MARIRSKDWDGLLGEYLLLKSAEPTLTHEEFYRRKALNRRTAEKRIGVRMTEEWEKVRKATLEKVERKASVNLADALTDVLKTGQAIMTRAAQAMFGQNLDGLNPEVVFRKDTGKRDKDGKPILSEGRVGDATNAFRVGASAVSQVSRILSGGERILEADEKDVTFLWVEPPAEDVARAKKAKGKRKKKAEEDET